MYDDAYCLTKSCQTLTVYCNKDITADGVNTIVSATSVGSFILSSDGQGKGNNTVIRKSCPGDIWCWITISCTVERNCVPINHCLIV